MSQCITDEFHSLPIESEGRQAWAGWFERPGNLPIGDIDDPFAKAEKGQNIPPPRPPDTPVSTQETLGSLSNEQERGEQERVHDIKHAIGKLTQAHLLEGEGHITLRELGENGLAHMISKEEIRERLRDAGFDEKLISDKLRLSPVGLVYMAMKNDQVHNNGRASLYTKQTTDRIKKELAAHYDKSVFERFGGTALLPISIVV